METRSVTEIEIGVRHRKDMGDVAALASNIQEVGLLHPIVIRADGTLIAGERRLSACRSLGWSEVPVTVVDLDDIIRGEFAENSQRKDFLPSEIDAIRKAMEPVEREAARGRQGARNDLVEHPGNFPESVQARDKIGAFAGVSGRTVEKIAKVVEAAEREPERFAPLVAEMDRTGKVDGAYKKLVVAERRREAIGISRALPEGKFGVIYADPPWSFEVWSGEGKDRAAENHYPTMSQQDIEALPIADLAADNCALFLWAVMPQLPEALRVIKAWGFEFKTCAFVWVKTTQDGERFATGMGYWTRANAELCLLATKGNPVRLSADVHQVVSATRVEHSKKPEEIADRIERLVCGPYLELFSRRPRDGWKAWGNQADE